MKRTDNPVPPCRNPHHPSGADRQRGMVILEENDSNVQFGCTTCRDAGIFSVQVRTLPRGWAKAKYLNELRGVQRMKVVRKMNKIVYFH